MPSILDELMSDGLPTVKLTWHYRSQHESLIAFSNRQYYESELATFPAADNRDRGVSFVHVANAVYDRGRTRTNRPEAEAIVAELVARMTACLRQPEERRLTFGVVTFNKQQQSMIEDLLDEARAQQPELEWFFADERFEPTVVKNLENVQGDERDVILFSITFGFDAKGAFPIDFGALNRDGGHRRLNVAVTRARRTLAVYASFLPDQLQALRSNARGVRDLKAFLEYAQRGAAAFTSRDTLPQASRSGRLEESIAAALVSRGWRVEQRVGVSDFRVDLGVVHPDRPDSFLAGVECDGERYGRSTVARDRDITRGLVLASLGWHIVRVWSIDWWYAPQDALQRLDEQLRELLRQERESHERNLVESPAPTATTSMATATSDSPSIPTPTMETPPREMPAGDISPREMPPHDIPAGETPAGDMPIYAASVNAMSANAMGANATDANATNANATNANATNANAMSVNTADAKAADATSPPVNTTPTKTTLATTILASVVPASVVPASVAEASVAEASVAEASVAEASAVPVVPRRWYEPLVLPDVSASKDRFDKPDYTETLRDIVLAVVMSHGPIRDDILASEVATCHGFQRTGKNIKERIFSVLPWTIATTETVGRFLWPSKAPDDFIPFRHPRPGARPREVDEISIQELTGLALELSALTTSDDPALAMARELGIERLTGPVRERLTLAIQRSRAFVGRTLTT